MQRGDGRERFAAAPRRARGRRDQRGQQRVRRRCERRGEDRGGVSARGGAGVGRRAGAGADVDGGGV